MIMDGKKMGAEMLEELRQKIKEKDLRLCLTAVLAGADPKFKRFVELKKVAAEKIGIKFITLEFPENISGTELRQEVEKISSDSGTNGILVELPLPEHINAAEVLDSIQIEKDVDVLSSDAQKRFYANQSKVMAPAAEAVKIVLEKYKISPAGKRAAVFGQGMLIGRPVAHWLETVGAEVFRIDEFTEQPQLYSLPADIVISGVGKPGLVKADMIKEGAVVLDFGYENQHGKMVGDVDFESVSHKAGLITPVPGGMGPIVIAAVLKNLVELN